MARLPLIDPEQTTGDARKAFDRMPVKLNIFRMMAHAEANFIPAMRYANSILHKQKLSHVNRELLIDPESLMTHFRQAELVKIAGAGHWLHHDRLDEVLASLRRFLGVQP